MFESLKKERSAQVVLLLFFVLTLWWVSIQFRGIQTETENYLFGGAYGNIALLGGLIGLSVARSWGALKSVMGTAIIVLALGLLFQALGQNVFWFYNFFLHNEIPYPSFADIGFFGSIPLYIYGILLLAKASGVKLTFTKVFGLLQAIIIPLIILGISYFLFIQKHEYDLADPLKTFLDAGYPIGQAIYISIAILTYSLSRNLLGGVMRSKILFLIFAFVMQYLAEFTFLLFQTEYYNASFIDYFYLIAYVVMALGLIQLGTVAKNLKENK